MPFDGPGLDYEPPEDRLIGFESLAPENDSPSTLARLLKAPLRLLAWPFRALGRLLTLPLRRRRRDDDAT